MPTQIKFVGADDNYVRAHEDVDEVLARWNQAGDEPFEVVTGKDRRTFVNPTQIACIRDSQKRSGSASFS